MVNSGYPSEIIELGRAVYALIITLLVLSWIAVALRLWVRLRLTKAPGWDDATILFTLVRFKFRYYLPLAYSKPDPLHVLLRNHTCNHSRERTKSEVLSSKVSTKPYRKPTSSSTESRMLTKFSIYSSAKSSISSQQPSSRSPSVSSSSGF